MVDVNLNGYFNVCKAVIPYMRKQGGGEQATMTMEEFAQRVNAEVAEQLKVLEE